MNRNKRRHLVECAAYGNQSRSRLLSVSGYVSTPSIPPAARRASVSRETSCRFHTQKKQRLIGKVFASANFRGYADDESKVSRGINRGCRAKHTRRNGCTVPPRKFGLLYVIAAIAAAIPTIFCRKNLRIVSAVILIASLALAANEYPEYSHYLDSIKEKSSKDSPSVPSQQQQRK